MATSTITSRDYSGLAGLVQLNAEKTLTINDVEPYALVFVVTLGCVFYFRKAYTGVADKTIIHGSDNITITHNGPYSITLTTSNNSTNWMVFYTKHKG